MDGLYFLIIGGVLLVGGFIWKISWFIYYANDAKEIVKKPFVCPGCGEKFNAKWYHINGFICRNNRVREFNKTVLKCPLCKRRDTCRWTGND